jgi:transposase
VGRRAYSREFKIEAVRLVRERGVTVNQAARDLGVHPNSLRIWVKELGADREQAFPGRGRMKTSDADVARLKRELAKAQAERDILKKAIAYFAKERP